MNKKKIAVIGLKGLPAFGGAATVGENIIDCLKEDYQFTVYATSSHTKVSGIVNGYKQIVFRRIPVKRIDIFFYYLMSALHAVFLSNYDLIHLHHIDGAIILFILRLRYRVVSTSHARSYTRDKWNKFEKKYFKINEKIFLRFSSVITVVSMELKKYYLTITNKEIFYIPNGTRLDFSAIEPSKIDEDNYILFAAGRIMSVKGCHILLEALQKINYKGKVLIIGDLEQVPKYKQKVIKLAESLDVKFIDLIKEKELLLGYVKKANIFVFPSSKEAMSIMLLEAATMKTPVICSDIPENKAVFNDEEVLFFQTDNSDDLAKKLVFALANLDILEEKADKAFAKLKKEFRWEKIATDYSKLFQANISF